jgi:hypothetical protein
MPALLQLGALFVVAWLPGMALYRAPLGGRERRAALEAEERWFWQIVLSLTVSLSVTLLLAALGRYTFERLLAGDVLVAVVAGAAARFGPGRTPAMKRPGAGALIPVALILLALVRFFPPAEYVIGGKDPGTYMNEGIQIAQRGSLVTIDEVIASVPPPARDLFFPSHENRYYYSLRFMGFFIEDPDSGAVVGQFPHLFPASIAIGYGIDGLTGARRTVGFWAALGLLAVYFAGVRIAGRAAATAAAALLGLHVLQVWYARYPSSEIVMQPLLFAAVLAADRALADDDGFFGLLAGVLLGLLIWLRFDVVLAIAAVAAAIAVAYPRRRTIPWALIVPLGLLSMLALAYLTKLMTGYSAYPLGVTRDWAIVPLLAGAASVVALLWIARAPSRTGRLERYLPVVLVAAGFAAAAYAWFLRDATGRTAIHDAAAFRTFTVYYLSPAGLIAALAGFAYVVVRRFWTAPATLLTICVFASFFFYKLRIVPEHFWMGRRFLPVILPGALLLVSAIAMASRGSASRARRIVGLGLGLGFLGLLGQHYARVAAPVRAHVEYAGIIPRLETLAATFGDRDLVVVESRDASDIHVLALPLAYIYARKVLVLANPVPDKTRFHEFLTWAGTRFDRVLFLGSGGTDLLSRQWSARSIASERFAVPEYETTPWHAFPRTVRQKEFDYGVYLLQPAEAVAASSFDLDVGIRDDLHVVRFHAKEESEGRWIRWTRGTSYVSITPVPAAGRLLTLWMGDGGRPPAAGPARVSVYLEEQQIGSVTVTTGIHPYEFAIPPELAAKAAAADPARLRLVSSLWSPHEVLGTGDDRQLGVMVDRVQVR